MTAVSGQVASALAWFNHADAHDLHDRLMSLTASPRWAEQVVAARPYPDLAALLHHCDEILSAVGVDQIDAALAGHPRIGERAAHLDQQSAARSAREQAGLVDADPQVVRALAEANAAYEQRFGRIYLVAAAGRSADQLLAIARSRLGNDPAAELDVVRAELATITRARITAWLTTP